MHSDGNTSFVGLFMLSAFSNDLYSDLLHSLGVYKASEARLLLLMYQVNYVNQLKDSAISPAKIIDDSWTMDGFVSLTRCRVIYLIRFS